MKMKIKYPEIGICGLSCVLCPNYNTDAKSRCRGCKSKDRMAVGCPFITCAIKNKGVEFCIDCRENKTCKLWKNHRAAGKKFDSFKCYQTLERDIVFMQDKGVPAFVKTQKKRHKLLKQMLGSFNEGRSKSYYCIAATVMEIPELEYALAEAGKSGKGLKAGEKSKALHAVLNGIAGKRKCCLKLRKPK